VARFSLKYADPRGEIHQLVIEAETEKELRDRYTQQGYLVYSIRERHAGPGLPTGIVPGRGKKVSLEKFLIFNQQFLTLVRAGLPILKGLDLLADRLTDPKLGKHIKEVRDEVKRGTMLSEAFRRQGVFPAMYVTSILAGEKSGSLAEVLERFIAYQRMALAVRKKIFLSLIYPAVLIFLVICLIVFLVTYVVPNFAQLYSSMSAQLPAMTQLLIAVGTTARNYILVGVLFLVGGLAAFRVWSRTEAGRLKVDQAKAKAPIFGDIWLKYHIAQLSRVLSTLLTGGIPLVQALDTGIESMESPVLRETLESSKRQVKEGRSLSAALADTGVFPGLAIDMIEVGESTGALPSMLSSVAEFYDDDVQTRMAAALSLVEPAIMIFMGAFVAFVLISLYLPIFSLADTFAH
jgi:type IV pilus assembly protein PilC